MKRIILYFTAILLLFSSCKKMPDSCTPPLVASDCCYNDIDWENYNDIWDVYASNNRECSDPKMNQNNEKNIKVWGWLMIENNEISITNDSLYALHRQREFNGRRSWDMPMYCTHEILTTIAMYDLTRKCYLKGEIRIEKIMDGKGNFCCQVAPRIVLKSINDINFE